jgi:hypothetical protein
MVSERVQRRDEDLAITVVAHFSRTASESAVLQR